MGASVQQGGGDDDEWGSGQPMSDINVTPFVDVVLVLLVIFMISAPIIMKESMNINLPKSGSGDGKISQTLGVVVTKSGQILLNGKMATESTIRTAVQAAIKEDPDTRAIISADQDARHGDVVRAIDLIKSSGMEKFAVEIKRD